MSNTTGFMSNMKQELEDRENVSVTENGATGYRTTGKALLDLNFSVSSFRGKSEKDMVEKSSVNIIEKFMAAYEENRTLAVKWLFYARDVRGGLGERTLFRVIFKHLAINIPWEIKHLIDDIGFYGRFDDLFVLFDTVLEDDMLDYVTSLLKQDLHQMTTNEVAGFNGEHLPVTLLAKWLPSINTSSQETRARAKKIAKRLNMDDREYRKTLSKMRRYLDVIEKKMSFSQWDQINYESVPSRANILYRHAFLRHDHDRYNEYIDKVTAGEAKINSSVSYPHEILHALISDQYNDDIVKSMQAMWDALPNLVEDGSSTIVVSDGSGSMQTGVGGTNIEALTVANALAIYFAERLSGDFHNRYITFSSRPQFVEFDDEMNLLDKHREAIRHTEISNTNVEAVFDLILSLAIRKHMKQEDIPSNILILSDMEFDDCAEKNGGGYVGSGRLFDIISDKYQRYGYKMPRLVFWNLCSRTGTIPVKENDLGVALVSGFSINIIKMVMSNALDPYKCLVEQLMSDRYKIIYPMPDLPFRDRVKDSSKYHDLLASYSKSLGYANMI